MLFLGITTYSPGTHHILFGKKAAFMKLILLLVFIKECYFRYNLFTWYVDEDSYLSLSALLYPCRRYAWLHL